MKKFLLLWLFFLVPFSSFAFESNAWDNLKVTFPINNDYYVAWWRIDIENNISWDLLMAWWELNVVGNVQDDIMIAWGKINIQGLVWDDVRAAGWDITISNSISGDLVVAWWNVDIRKGVVIAGDLIVSAWRVTLDGDVKWWAKIFWWELNMRWTIAKDVEIKNEKINLWENARIGWKLTYYDTKKNPNLEKIVASNNIEYRELKDATQWFRQEMFKIISGYIAYRILFLTVFGILFIFAFPKILAWVGDVLRNNPWKSFLVGFLMYAAIPFLVILLLISALGIPFGLFLLFIYIFMFVFYKLINVTVFSSLIIEKMGGFDTVVWWKKLLVVVGFAILFGLLSLIDLFAVFFAAGALAIKKYELFKKVI